MTDSRQPPFSDWIWSSRNKEKFIPGTINQINSWLWEIIGSPGGIHYYCLPKLFTITQISYSLQRNRDKCKDSWLFKVLRIKSSWVLSPKQKDIYASPSKAQACPTSMIVTAAAVACTGLPMPTMNWGGTPGPLPFAAELQAVFSCVPNHERTTHQQIVLNLWTHTTLVNISKWHTKQKSPDVRKGLGRGKDNVRGRWEKTGWE